MKLSEAKKEIAQLGKDQPYIITVGGYNKLNQIAGLYIITPPTIASEGKEYANPYVQYEDGEIKRVICRKIAVGYTPVGNLVAIDTVRHYNFEAYFLQDIINKAQYNPDEARFGSRFICPLAPKEEPKTDADGTVYVKTDEGKVFTFQKIKGSEGVWIDTSGKEVRKVYSQHIQHQKFGDAIAQSMTARNAMKAHPAIAATTVEVKGGIATVQVFGFRNNKDSKELESMAAQIAKGGTVEGVQVLQDTGDAEIEEVNANEISEVDETSAVGAGSQPVNDVDWKASIAKAKELAAAKKVDLDKFCKNAFESRFDSITADQMLKLIPALESITSDVPAEGAQKK
jgi:hypothetical protein